MAPPLWPNWINNCIAGCQTYYVHTQGNFCEPKEIHSSCKETCSEIHSYLQNPTVSASSYASKFSTTLNIAQDILNDWHGFPTGLAVAGLRAHFRGPSRCPSPEGEKVLVRIPIYDVSLPKTKKETESKRIVVQPSLGEMTAGMLVFSNLTKFGLGYEALIRPSISPDRMRGKKIGPPSPFIIATEVVVIIGLMILLSPVGI